MPRELIASAKEQVAFREYQSPALQAGQVRVKSLFGAAKHGTEMAIFKGYAGPRGGYDAEYRIFTPEKEMVRYPANLGNMCVGEVVELGPQVSRLKLGDRVFSHGPLRQEHVWPETVRSLPQDVPWQAAVCLDPADFALGAVRDGHLRLGDAVAVFGMGAIGLMTLQMARLSGAATVIAVEPIYKRRVLAFELGADHAMDPTACDVAVEIKHLTDKKGVDVAVEASGNYGALHQAVRCVHFAGLVVPLAFYTGEARGLRLGEEWHINRITMRSSRSISDPNRDHPMWDQNRIKWTAFDLLRAGKVSAKGVVFPVVPFEASAEAYRRLDEAPHESIKLGVTYS